MSIESRLAAKKRSAKARSKARAKAAFDLGLIILIPVAVLVIVFLVMNHIKSKVNDYSKYLTSEGNIKDYDISKEVTIPDLSTLPVKALPARAETVMPLIFFGISTSPPRPM